jgi:hypothetical protein
MTAKPSREQLPFYTRFVRLVDDEGFTRDIETLRSSDVDILKSTYENIEEFEDGTVNADEIPSPLHQVMMKHNLPLVMEDFIHHYVAHNEIALDVLSPSCLDTHTYANLCFQNTLKYSSGGKLLQLE